MSYANQVPPPPSDCQPSAARMSDAERVMILLDELVKASDDLSTFASSKLSNLVHPEPPSTGDAKPIMEQVAPLFSEYRNRIMQVRDAIKRARFTIERVEV